MRDGTALDLDALLHPARAFAHPNDVLADPALTLQEKRAILASWASDACAVEAAPALRCLPGGSRHVSFDDVMDALMELDRRSVQPNPQGTPVARRRRHKLAARIPALVRGRRNQDQPLT